MKINNKKGFTLIELMVVIAIIGILATAGIQMYGTYQAKARDTKRMTNLNNLSIWLQWYYTDKTTYPPVKSTPSCFADVNWIVHDSLKSYYDNKAIPLDPQKWRTAWDCTVAGSPLYKPLNKDSFPNTAYILGSNLEVKDKANLKYNSREVDFAATNGTLNNLSDADRNTADAAAKKNILYAIVAN